MPRTSLTSRTSSPVPILDTIRTVRVKGQTDGVDAATAALNKLTASIQAANDNLMRTSVAAKEASDGWSITGEGALSAANRLRDRHLGSEPPQRSGAGRQLQRQQRRRAAQQCQHHGGT